MKMKHYIVIGAILLVLPMLVPSAVAQTDECSTPVATLQIRAEGFAFNVTEFQVDTGDCLKISFENFDNSGHTFTLEDENGDVWVNLALSSAGEVKTVNIIMPSNSVELIWYCSIAGHRDAGMQGTMTVGVLPSDNPSGDDKDSDESGLPGFGWVLAINAIVAVVGIKKIRQ